MSVKHAVKRGLKSLHNSMGVLLKIKGGLQLQAPGAPIC